MRTPGILIFGLVLAPCGWILNLTSTVAPAWRQIYNVANQAVDVVINQGIWDICQSSTISSSITCNLRGNDQTYFNNQVIPVAEGLMIASLIVTAIGLAVLTPATRCWTDRRPRWVLAGIGGILIFCSGVLTIIPISWYTNKLTSLNTTTTFSNAQNPDIRVGYCIVLGYIGGIMEVLAGIVVCVGFCRCCGGRNREEPPKPARAPRYSSRAPNPVPYPRNNIPRSATPSSSSVANSRYSVDDELDYPRAKAQRKGTVNPAYNGRPYDADL
ncbi:claudin-23-like [Tachysurus fulvidraco]|uniref:claudin-23-like n=1 Tax=Tachysurus fulvidraco TaxID=1234273 RepID=UPI001FF03DD3|nr:claudin-23-like [Tachysurus fulvidraco]